MSFAFQKAPRISLTQKLVPVQYREHEHGQQSMYNKDSNISYCRYFSYILN